MRFALGHPAAFGGLRLFPLRSNPGLATLGCCELCAGRRPLREAKSLERCDDDTGHGGSRVGSVSAEGRNASDRIGREASRPLWVALGIPPARALGGTRVEGARRYLGGRRYLGVGASPLSRHFYCGTLGNAPCTRAHFSLRSQTVSGATSISSGQVNVPCSARTCLNKSGSAKAELTS